ncbi:hypothetical protein CA13_30250 [Planctomycetes bacterium CA13]|uniref:Uncharacterized protein n=1 Tax=Novipirellula herctigrandis TaxID=2527986 RepID=A0A5C5Z2G9_9BACT|nr:hypothetical protein CA13_30250 [Planctomycetes bacterium CA13]
MMRFDDTARKSIDSTTTNGRDQRHRVRGANEHIESYRFGRGMAYALMNTFSMRMAAVFMFVTSTIGLRTQVLSKWISVAGFVFGLVLLLAITGFAWIALLFGLWVLLVSTYVLFVNVTTRPDAIRSPKQGVQN